MDLSCDKYGHVRSEVTDSCQAAKFTHCLVLCSSVKCGYILGSHVILNHTWNAVWLYCSHREKLGKNPLNEHVVIKGSNIHLNVLVKAFTAGINVYDGYKYARNSQPPALQKQQLKQPPLKTPATVAGETSGIRNLKPPARKTPYAFILIFSSIHLLPNICIYSCKADTFFALGPTSRVSFLFYMRQKIKKKIINFMLLFRGLQLLAGTLTN
jgi:hypothetical protein